MEKPNENQLWWEKDLLNAKESAIKAISVIHEGKGDLFTEDLILEAKKIIEWYYWTNTPQNPYSEKQKAAIYEKSFPNQPFP